MLKEVGIEVEVQKFEEKVDNELYVVVGIRQDGTEYSIQCTMDIGGTRVTRTMIFSTPVIKDSVANILEHIFANEKSFKKFEIRKYIFPTTVETILPRDLKGRI